MIGPDALKWSWLMLGFGLLLVADGWFNWGMFNSRRDPMTNQTLKYGSFGRITRMTAGSIFTTVGAVGLGYLAWVRLHP